MRIGIIGTGNVGASLGRAWAAAGHEVVFGARDTAAAKVADLLQSMPGKATAEAVAEAIRASEVLLLALPGVAVGELVRDYRGDLDGKIIVDATNSTGQPEMHNMTLLEGTLPKAEIFRAFNTLGWENFAQPMFGEERADLFYCGAAGDARDSMDELINDVGLRPIYVGGTEMAPLLDNLTRLWFTLVFAEGYGRHTAFRLLTD
ncbi:MAG: NAD(P)-binding domain-containing protein [Chloroflexi bacterium]|jgi:predicted dinucleotide-binding enzyme|nr:NAD(P)-binding domain-containing protein [Chloroflexota bacterium]